jgi:AraC family transcriptional regulator
MNLVRSRTEFWGRGPAHREAGGFSFHLLAANAPEDEVRPHTHEEAHFVLVLDGGYLSSAASAPFVSCAPLLVFNPAGTTHRDRFHEGRGRFFAISGGVEEGGARALTDPWALWCARAAAVDFAASDATALRLEACALQLIACVRPAAGDDEPVRGTRPPSWLKSVFEMSFTSDDSELNASDLAAHAGVHPVHLARVYRRWLHCSPGEYLRGRRLERAAALLGTGTASLAEVAATTGFVDQAHLTRQFRTAFETTPARWRQRRQVAEIQDELPPSP